MQANTNRATSAELALRAALDESRLAYEVDTKPEPDLRIRADFVFAAARACVFVDGCFWHRCPEHYTAPRTNAAWWEEKIEANVERDRRQTSELQARGWAVIRVWEHEATPALARAAAATLVRLIGGADSAGEGETPTGRRESR